MIVETGEIQERYRKIKVKEDMVQFLGKAFKSYSKLVIVALCYMVVVPPLHNCAHAISLHKDVKVPALLVFGDSIVDPGNNNDLPTIAKANFPPYGRDFEGGISTGRFSNGKVPSDFVAEELGIKEHVPPYRSSSLQISDLLTGVSFASGGAGYDPESAKLANTLSLTDQLELFKGYTSELKAAVGENTTATIISQSIYLVCVGSNDITNTYFAVPLRRLHYNISSYTGLMVNWASNFVQELYSLGARRIGVLSAPPCGCLPAQRTVNGGLLRGCANKENLASMLFNNRLISELSFLNQKLMDSRIVYLDIYNSLLDLIAHPSQSGFQVADRGCCGTGLIEATLILCTELNLATCKDASKYIFWDSFHPTEATYRILVHGLLQKSLNDFF